MLDAEGGKNKENLRRAGRREASLTPVVELTAQAESPPIGARVAWVNRRFG